MKEPTRKKGLKSIALLCATAFGLGAYAATPLAVWNGDFNTDTIRNGVTFSANDNTINADGSVTIKEGATTGISFDLPSVYDYVTLVFTVSNVTGEAAADGVLASTRYNGSANAGVYVKSGGLSTGGMTGTTAWSTDNVGGTITSYADDANAVRTFALTQVNSSKLQNGLHLWEVYGGGTAAAVVYGSNGSNGLRYGNGYDTLTIGGFKTAPTEEGAIGAMEGLTVMSVAVYVGNTTWPVTAGALADFAMPATLNTDATSVSAINTANNGATDAMFVNFTTIPAALTADATPDANLTFSDSQFTALSLADGVLNVAGSLPVKLPSSGVTSVTGSGVVVAEGETEIAALPGNAFASPWTGTVWLKNRTGWTNFDPTAYGNAGSTLRFSGIQGHFAKAKYNADVMPVVELVNDTYDYALNLNNGYSFNSNGGWSYVQTSELKGDGTLLCNTGGGALFIVKDKWSDFTGTLTMNNKTVWLGFDAPAETTENYTWGTVSGGVRIADGKEVTITPNAGWTFGSSGGFIGGATATVKLLYPWQATSYIGTNAKWTGTIELASYTATDNVAINLANMGRAGSKIVLKGLVNNAEANRGPYIAPADGSTVNAEVVIDGAVTFGAANSGKKQTLNKISGVGNLTFSYTGSHSYYLNNVSEYTGTISAAANSKVYLGIAALPKLGDLVVKVDESSNNVDTTVTVVGSTAKLLGGLKTVDDVYGLYIEPSVTMNEKSYVTIADALAEAEEGDTITLSRSVTEDAFTVGKDITIDANELSINTPSITIAKGKTLTINGNKRHSIDVINGGNLVFGTGGRWYSAGDSTVESITCEGDFTLEGWGDITVTGDVEIAKQLKFNPPSASSAIVTHNATYTTKLIANKVTATTLTGGGTIETAEGVVAQKGTFYGTILGENGLTTTGAFTLQGSGNGPLNVSSGTVTIGNRLADMTNIRFHLDATDSTSYTLEDDTSNLSKIKGSGYNYALVSGKTAAVLNTGNATHFGGRPYFQFNDSQYTYGNKIAAWSYIAVTQPDELAGYLARYNDQDRLGISSSKWFARRYGSNCDGLIYQNGQVNNLAAAIAQDTIVSLPMEVVASNQRADTLGVSYKGAIAEFVGFSSNISLEDRAACEMFLMDKWNLACAADVRPFATDADISVATGATLDLGGYTQTVASFTGGGTVQNGTLLTTGNVYTNNGALTIAAVDNMTVVLDAGATALTLNGSATGVKVTATDAFVASGATVAVTATDTTPDFSELPNDIFRFGVTDNENGMWTVGAQVANFEAATYTWSPVGSSTDWTSLANWKVGAQAVAVLPQNVDTVVFPELEEDAVNTLVLDVDQTVHTIIVNGKTRISGAGVICYGIPSVEVIGTGTLYLGQSGAIMTRQSKVVQTLTIRIPSIVIEGTAEKPSYIAAYRGGTNSGSAPSIVMTSEVSGSGYVELGGWRSSFNLDALKWAAFTGNAIIFDDGIPRNSTKFSNTGTSSGEPWDLSNSKWEAHNTNNFTPSGSTYRFGELTGYPRWGDAASYSSATLYIGCLNTDFALDGHYNPGSGKDGNHIIKEGTGTMTFSGDGVESYTVEAGTLVLADNDTLPDTTLTMSGGTLAVTALVTVEDTPAVIDEQTGEETTPAVTHQEFLDPSAKLRSAEGEAVKFTNNAEESHKWATALDASNTALVKSGAGTLTLEARPLAENFTITVAENGGSVVVPTGSYTLGTRTYVASTADGNDTLAYAPAVVKYNADGTVAGTEQSYSVQTLAWLVNTAPDGAYVVVYDGTDTEPTGDLAALVSYDAETHTYTKAVVNTVDVNGTKYPTLAAALADANLPDGATVTLLADISEAITYTGASELTIDLNGQTWSFDDANNWAAFINNGATVTFKDSVGGGTIEGGAKFCVWARTGSIVIESGTYENNSNDNYAVYVGTTDANLPGDAPTATITGGTFVNWNTAEYIYKAGWSRLNLNVKNYDANDTKMATTLIQVSGGTFTWNPALGDDNMGGTFVAEGCLSNDNGDGTYTVRAVNYVAQIVDGGKYESIADALANTEASATVKLLAAVSESVTYTGANAVTIDLNGQTWSFDDANNWAAFINNGATVTFRDSVGGGTIEGGAKFCVWARTGSIVIESGTYENDSNDNYAVYVGTTDANLPGDAPTATITGGTFVNWNTAEYIYKAGWSRLNLNVKNYDENDTKMATTLIQVSGGTFTWDPALGDDNMGGTFVAEGYQSTETSVGSGVWEVTLAPTGIDPESNVLETTVAYENADSLTGDDLTAAVVAAAVAGGKIKPPADANVSSASDYAAYFTYEVTGESGNYTLTLKDVKEEVVEDADNAAITTLLTSGDTTVSVKPGLYYAFVAGDTPTINDPATLTLATTDEMAVTRPTGTGKGFFKVVVSPTQITATP